MTFMCMYSLQSRANSAKFRPYVILPICKFKFKFRTCRILRTRRLERRVVMSTRPCVICAHPSTTKCGACKKVYYCSKEHQEIVIAPPLVHRVALTITFRRGRNTKVFAKSTEWRIRLIQVSSLPLSCFMYFLSAFLDSTTSPNLFRKIFLTSRQ